MENLVLKQQAILQLPGLLDQLPFLRIISRLVDLSCSLSQAKEYFVDFCVRIGVIIHRRLLAEIRKKQWIFANSLNGLQRR